MKPSPQANRYAKVIPVLAVLLLTVLSLSACKANLQAQSVNPPEMDPAGELDNQGSEDGRRLFLRGITEYEFGNYEYAAELLADASDLMGENASASLDYTLAETFLELDDESNALFYAEQAVEKEGSNKWYRIKLAEVYRILGRSDDSIAQLEESLKITPGDVDVLYTIARIHGLSGDYEQANETYNRIINYTGSNLQVLYNKYQNFTMMGDEERAIGQLEEILELDSGDLRAIKLLGKAYMEQGNTEKAIQTLKEAIRLNPDDEEILSSLSNLYIRENRWEEATQLLSGMIRNPAVELFTKTELIRFFYSRLRSSPDDEQLRQATEELVELLLEKEPEEGYVHSVAASYYNLIGNDARTLGHLESTNNYLPGNESAWRQRLQILLGMGRYEEVITVGKKADEAIPDDAFVLFFTGNAHLIQGDYEAAAEVLQRASSAPANRDFKSTVYGSLGDALSSLDRWEDADQAYERALRMNSDNDVVLNNYAYYLVQRDKELDRALEMSERSLELNPENASYLDTYGWIHFKLGNFGKAEEYIKASIATGEASATVYEHLGDVYAAQDNMQEARNWWQQALDKDESKTHLPDKIEASGS